MSVPLQQPARAIPALDSLEPVRESMLVFGQPEIRDEEIDEVVATLRSRWIGTGPRTRRFEQEFAGYVGAPGAVATSSCTAALTLALRAAGVGPGDEVITTPLTFVATANAVLHVGATPVLADVDPDSQNLDPRAAAAAITPRTKAILPVHFGGRPCAMGPLAELAAHADLKLIEDCAHAIETTEHGVHAGTFGDFGCFSFYATKNVTTAEGGMVVARDEDTLDRLRVLSLHGLSRDAWNRFGAEGYRHYAAVDVGYKCNMTDLQASLGIHQLARVEASLLRREAIWAEYDRALADLPLALPAPAEPGTRHARHLYTVLVDEAVAGLSRDAFLQAMTRQNIGVGVHYLSLPEHPCYQNLLGWNPADWPVAERIGRQTVSLPLTPALTDEDVAQVVLAVRRALGAA